MARTVAIGIQDFEQVIQNNYFYVDTIYNSFIQALLVGDIDAMNDYMNEVAEEIFSSNRESGFGRYDVILEPVNVSEDGINIEFKVRKPKKERSLQDTVASALRQIEEKHYDRELLARGIPNERIHKYGFAFEGKKVRIGGI